MVLSRAIFSVLGLLGAFALYQIFWLDALSWRWILAALIFIGIMVYVFQPQINYWWMKRQNVQLNPLEHHFLLSHFPYYQQLSEEDQKAFGQQCLFFVEAKDFILQGVPSLPDDIKLLIAAQAVGYEFLFAERQSCFADFERIAIYPHPFISPDIDQVHASETHFGDKVWIFSLQQLLPGITQPKAYFNVVAYEFAKTLNYRHPDWFAELKKLSHEEIWLKLEQEYGKTLPAIQRWINLEEIDPIAVYLTELLFNASAKEIPVHPKVLPR